MIFRVVEETESDGSSILMELQPFSALADSFASYLGVTESEYYASHAGYAYSWF